MKLTVVKLATWLALGVILTGSIAVVASSGARIDEGDYVTYHATIRRSSDGVVLFTTDTQLAEQEAANGNPWLLPPEQAVGYYGERSGFVTLSNGTSFDHVPYLLGREAGDVVLSLPMQMPFEHRENVALSRVVRSVATTFVLPHEKVTKILTKENASMDNFRYLGDFSGRAVSLNQTHDRVTISVPLDETFPNAMDMPTRVLTLRENDADFEILLEEGDVFRVTRCAESLGVEAGRYRVVSTNVTSYTLEHVDAQDAIAQEPVTLELQVLGVNNWPGLFKTRTRIEVTLRDWKTW
jgi:hypothetical protein